ncbi:MAG: alanine racemase [Candidatus Endonucleobacter sp. (ex Gigantidas childressi)]|nr:alanine racemase [Candidatus Endonucleobacter sp. (ex Gigantidas childressi)]
MGRPTKAVINLNALRNNYFLAKDISGGKVVAVIKANAYSHGAVRCAQALADIADAFAVSCIEEALELREAGITQPIILLEGFFDALEIPFIVKHQLDTVVHCNEQLEILENSQLQSGIRVWLKMDTGMHRIGFMPNEYRDAWRRLNAIQKINDIVLMSHLACADEPDISYTMRQLEVFEEYSVGLPGNRSISNSAGLIAYSGTSAEWCRPGLMLYGVSPFSCPHSLEQRLQPVMELHSSIISIKDIPAGSAVGYGSSWIADTSVRLGVVAIGYADGYPRHAESKTPVMVNGLRVPLIGRVSMDMLTVDLTTQPKAKVGDNVLLWGEQLLVSEIAHHSNTVAYQLLCNLNRVSVEYRKQEQSAPIINSRENFAA